ncbi:MAG: hypothetical protein HYZ25_01340 [Chloroflexi bacterium]|nr:hypothetical protein [Chloroflexota bacterium]
MTETSATVCYVHPSRETTLRCNQCDRPICTSCAIRTPTGYRCKECVKGQQKKFDTAEWFDYLFGFSVAGILSLITSLLAMLVSGFGFFLFFLIAAASSTVGVVIAEAARFVTRRHRSRRLYLTVVAGMVLGAAPMIIISLIMFDIYSLISLGIYLVIAVPVMYYRLSGLQLFKS